MLVDSYLPFSCLVQVPATKGIAVTSRFLLLPLRDMPVAVSRTVQQLVRPYRTARAAVPFDEQLPRLRLRLYTRRQRFCRLTRRSRAWPHAADLPRRLPTLSECVSIVRSLINRTGSMLGSGVETHVRFYARLVSSRSAKARIVESPGSAFRTPYTRDRSRYRRDPREVDRPLTAHRIASRYRKN